MTDPTVALMDEWESLDARERGIVDVLLQQAAAAEDAERRRTMASTADVQELRDSLARIERVVELLNTRVGAAQAGVTNGVAHPPTVAELTERVRAQEAQNAENKAMLRARLGTVAAPAAAAAAVAPAPPAPPAPPVAPVAANMDVPAPRTFGLTEPPMTGSDVKRFQRDLNRRLVAAGAGSRIHEDGRYGTATRDAARRVLLGLGVMPADYAHGITPRLRVLIRRPSLRSPAQIAAGHARRPAMKAHHERVAAAVSPAATGDTAAAAIRRQGGHWEDAILREAARHGLPAALVCAVIETETHFRNVFGHDGVANPVKSPPHGLLEVTRERYRQYVAHRDAGQGCQGVGPMQLTSKGLQDRADALGGCWSASANIRVGCELLAANIRRLGSTRAGVRAYNGSGPAAEHYATVVLQAEQAWHRALAGTRASAPAPAAKTAGGPHGPHAPRTFALRSPAMAGSDVRRFQRDLNERFDAWKIAAHIGEDGHYGAATRHAAHQVLLGLGIAKADLAGGITPELRSAIRNPSRRTPAQIATAKGRASYLDRLRRRSAAAGGGGGALRLRAYGEARRMLDLDVRESGGNNRGRAVTEIIRANCGTGPEPWCGDFMAWCYRKAGSKCVTRSWAQVRAVAGIAGVKRTKTPLKGDLVQWSFDHISMFVSWCDGAGHEVPMGAASHVKSIDGNTTRAGAIDVNDSAGGADGIYLKVRPRTLVTQFMHVTR